MYKDLNNSIKDFSPTTEEFNEIVNNYLQHSFIHSGENLFGEKYEAWVYEYLKAWASNCPSVSTFLKKGLDCNPNNDNGLNYDKNGQIIISENGKKIAEIDSLFTYKGNLIFVESSVSELRQYYRKLEDKLLYKRELLSKIFNTDDIYYLVVTRPKKKSLVYRSLPHLVLYKLKNPDFDLLEKTDRVSNFDSDKVVTIKDFISSFSDLSSF